MKKIIIVCCIFLCACSHENGIETFVEQNNNIAIAITYPTTGISKMDDDIKKYVDSVYRGFKEDYENLTTNEGELNVDYEYETLEQYTSVVLTTFINANFLAHPIHEIKTFVYKNNQKINFSNLIEQEKEKELIPYVKQALIQKYKDCILLETLDTEITATFQNYDTFAITQEGVKLYFNPYIVTSGNCGIIDIIIPFDKMGLSLQPTFKEIEYVTNPISKVIDPNKKMVAITFDDGPSKYTKEILNVLEQYQATATFFVLGNKVKTYQETINRIIALGNEIGNHSYSHKWLTRLEEEELQEQIQKTQDILQERNQYTPRLLRPTYGSVNKRLRNSTELQVVLWDVDSLDWKIKDSKKIAQRVLEDTSDLDIILFHDIRSRTIEAVKIVLSELQKEGYQFVTVSELQEVKFLREKIK